MKEKIQPIKIINPLIPLSLYYMFYLPYFNDFQYKFHTNATLFYELFYDQGTIEEEYKLGNS
jgi:hypothetical protein